MRKLTQQRLKEVLQYDALTGVFTNRKSRAHAKAGAVAGHLNHDGYRLIKIDGCRYFAGHLAWLWVTGSWPIAEIDHRNRERGDDRFSNLREASRSQNCANKPRVARPNKFGFKGVKKNSKIKFTAVICLDQQELYLGTYSSAEIAAMAYDQAAKKYHGAFAHFNFPARVHRDWILI